MKSIWPEDEGTAFADVFEDGDPCPGKPIEDRYGLVCYGDDEHDIMASVYRLRSLGVSTDRLFELYDPDEYARVEELADRRAAARRRRQGSRAMPIDWCILDLSPPDGEEAILERLGLTMEEARELCS